VNSNNKKSRVVIVMSFFLFITVSAPAFEQEIKGEELGERGKFINAEIARTLEDTENKDSITLPLKLALGIALENNLDIQTEKISIPISEKVIIEKDALFDPSLFGEFTNRRFEQQTSSALSGTPIFKENEQHGKLGIRKLFRFGLEAETYIESGRYRDNSDFEGLDPQYKNFFIFSLRQPLLEDFGSDINTTDINIAKNDLKIMQNAFVSQAITTLNQVEETYYDLSGSIESLGLRKESLRLAEELLSDNRKRFKAGITHIGQVQEAETAVASRQEEVIAAHQEVKDVTNILKNMLQIQASSPLYPINFRTERLVPRDEKIPSVAEAYKKALAKRPDYVQKKIVVKNKDVLLKYRKNQLLPRLDLIGTFGLNGLSGEAEAISFAGMSSKSPFGGGYGDSWDHLIDGDGYEWLIGLTIDIPLGNRADRSRYEQSNLDKKRAVMELKNLEDKIDLEIKVAMEDIQSSLDRIDVAEKFVSLAATSLHQEEERMKEGLSDTFRILIFQNGLIDAEIRKVRALVDYRKALARLYMAMDSNIERHDMALDFTNAKRSVQ